MHFFLTALVAATMANAAEADRIKAVLDRKIVLFSTPNVDEFPEFCKEYRLPCGEERFLEKSFEQTPYYVFRRTNLTGRAILDEIVKRHPDYAWQIEDGILTFAPRDRNVSFLERKISHFEAHSKHVDDAIYQAGLSVGIYPGGWGYSGYVDPEKERLKHLDEKKNINVSLDGVTVRQLFNSVVSAHGYATWLVLYSKDRAYYARWAWFPVTYGGDKAVRAYIY